MRETVKQVLTLYKHQQCFKHSVYQASLQRQNKKPIYIKMVTYLADHLYISNQNNSLTYISFPLVSIWGFSSSKSNPRP